MHQQTTFFKKLHFGIVFPNEFAYLNQNPLLFVKSVTVLNSQ